MYLLNAIIVKGQECKDPDSNGGFELGTWDLGSIRRRLAKIIGKEELETGYQFSEEECIKITKWLEETVESLKAQDDGSLSFSDKDEEERLKLGPYSQEAINFSPKSNPLCLNNIKWYKRLIEIFKSGKACFYHA